MRIARSRGLLFLILSTTLFLSPTAKAQEKKPSAGNPALAGAAQVGDEVQKALVKANAAGLGGLRLTKAVLLMETGSAMEGGVKLNFIIFTIGHTEKKGRTITSTLTFGELARLHAAGRPNLASLTDSLSHAIATAAAVATEVQVLRLTEATIKVEFVVEKKSDGGLSFHILGVDVDGNIDLEKASKNSLEVTFSR